MKIYFLITSMIIAAISCITTDVNSRITLLTISLIFLYADQIAEVINTQNIKVEEEEPNRPKEITHDFT